MNFTIINVLSPAFLRLRVQCRTMVYWTGMLD